MNFKKILKIVIRIVLILVFIISSLVLILGIFLYYDLQKDNAKFEKKIETHKVKSIIPQPGNRLYPEGGFNKILKLEDNFKGIRTKKQIERKYDKNYLQLYHGIQGGVYYYDAWLNIEENGIIFIKAFYIGTNLELSKNRIKEKSTIEVNNTNGKIKRFSSNKDFKIYEGDWGDYYGSRFEIWHKSYKTGKERKLVENYYIIEGWQR